MKKYYEMLELDKIIRKQLVKEGKFKGEIRKKFIDAEKRHKKELREAIKEEEFDNGNVIIYGGDYDRMWKKLFFPNESWTEEQKQKFIDYNWKHYKPTYYDCTGQIFTTRIKIYNTPNGVIAYIFEAMDV